MFERFRHEAKAAVIRAQEVAREAGDRQVDSRHLLVALAEGGGPAAAALRSSGSDPGDVAARAREELRSSGLDRDALASVGVDLDAVTAHAEQVFGPDALRAPGGRRGHIPFSHDSKKSLELALREVVRLHERTIDGRHLLLGVIRADGPGRDVLDRAQIDLAALRRTLEAPAEEAAG